MNKLPTNLDVYNEFHYVADEFRWREPLNGRSLNKPAGGVNKDGTRNITWNGSTYNSAVLESMWHQYHTSISGRLRRLHRACA